MLDPMDLRQSPPGNRPPGNRPPSNDSRKIVFFSPVSLPFLATGTLIGHATWHACRDLVVPVR
jgi:hypothetical protein